jgi:hypothetical protein
LGSHLTIEKNPNAEKGKEKQTVPVEGKQKQTVLVDTSIDSPVAASVHDTSDASIALSGEDNPVKITRLKRKVVPPLKNTGNNARFDMDDVLDVIEGQYLKRLEFPKLETSVIYNPVGGDLYVFKVKDSSDKGMQAAAKLVSKDGHPWGNFGKDVHFDLEPEDYPDMNVAVFDELKTGHYKLYAIRIKTDSQKPERDSRFQRRIYLFP